MYTDQWYYDQGHFDSSRDYEPDADLAGNPAYDRGYEDGQSDTDLACVLCASTYRKED